MAWTIDAIKTTNREAGKFYFDGKTMRFFRSRTEKKVFEGPGGIYIVTSEQFVGSDGAAAPREWTVRSFDPETGDVATVEEAKDLTRASAMRCARDLSDGIARDRLRNLRRPDADEVGHDDWSEKDEAQADASDVEMFKTTLKRELPGLSPGILDPWAAQLIKWGRQLHLYAEEDCNGTLTAEQTRRGEQLQKRIAESCEQWGCKAVIQGDPRGAVLRIALPSGETYGDLGGRGLAAPYHAGWSRPE